MSLRRRLRLIRRSPRKAYRHALIWLVRRLTGSPLVHTAIGDGEVVIDPAFVGDRAWPHIAYVLRYPSLAGYYIVPVEVDLPFELDVRPRRPWATVLRWLTGGRWRARDCVQVVAGYLRVGGVDVPDRITTPAQLHQWLRGQGYDYEQLV